MTEPIGPQHGIEAFRQHMKSLYPEKAWPDKLAATLLELVEGHNANLEPTPTPEPEPEPEPTPPPVRLAPRTYNKAPTGQDARFCTQGLPMVDGAFVDAGGFRYDTNGLSLGGRDPNRIVAGLKPSNEMDGRGACEGYGPFPGGFDGWPEDSYLR